MTPELDFAGLKKPKPWEYVLRFVFGGLVTVSAGLVTDHFGPVVGGCLLAFPAILPASLTLVMKHDGRARALDEARGGRLGSVGLMAFAAVVWGTVEEWPLGLSLAVATVVWLAVDGASWWLVHGRE